jgi:hypothetical protein
MPPTLMLQVDYNPGDVGRFPLERQAETLRFGRRGAAMHRPARIVKKANSNQPAND